jgi:hypothetical protein
MPSDAARSGADDVLRSSTAGELRFSFGRSELDSTRTPTPSTVSAMMTP